MSEFQLADSVTQVAAPAATRPPRKDVALLCRLDLVTPIWRGALFLMGLHESFAPADSTKQNFVLAYSRYFLDVKVQNSGKIAKIAVGVAKRNDAGV